jgi:hypothetical protein
VAQTSGASGTRVLGEITAIELIASGRQIRERSRLMKVYGARWRKLKGIAVVLLPDGSTARAEVHWYERHGLGRRELKIKRLLGDQK